MPNVKASGSRDATPKTKGRRRIGKIQNGGDAAKKERAAPDFIDLRNGSEGSAASQETDETYPAILRAAQDFATARGHSVVVYILAKDEAIGTKNVREVAECVRERKFDELDLVIHSTGGDIHAAFQLISFLKHRAKRLYACIPQFARSAATLLCIGADEIILDDFAALGPLDAQVFAGSSDGGRPDYQSALNQFKSLERLRAFSLETMRFAAEALYDRKIRHTPDLMKYAMDFVAITARPLFEKIEAHKLGDYSQALAIGEEYGRRVLKRVSSLDSSAIDTIVQQLVHSYPSHEYVIDCDELQKLRLPATRFSHSAERRAVRALADHVAMRGPGAIALIALIDPGKEVVREAIMSKSIPLASGNPWSTEFSAAGEEPPRRLHYAGLGGDDVIPPDSKPLSDGDVAPGSPSSRSERT
jgi:ATP-dependent protease ClpP protease subunit